MKIIKAHLGSQNLHLYALSLLQKVGRDSLSIRAVTLAVAFRYVCSKQFATRRRPLHVVCLYVHPRHQTRSHVRSLLRQRAGPLRPYPFHHQTTSAAVAAVARQSRVVRFALAACAHMHDSRLI